MLKPHELRARAAQLRAEAQGIYDTVKGDATGRDFTDDELKAYDAKLDEAEGLLKRADADEAREARLGKLTADIAARPAPGPGGRQSDPLPHQDPSNTRDHDGNQRQYSLLKGLRQMDPRNRTEVLDGLEKETQDELQKRRGRPARGLLVPWDLPVDSGVARRFARAHGIEMRDLTTSTGGGATITVVATTMIDILRNMMLSTALGVRVMNNMQGNFSIPKQTGTGTAYWVTEGNAPTESNPTIGAVNFTPSTVGAYSDYSRRFLEQTAVDAEAFIRQDLAQVLAVEMDRVTFNGSGAGAEPQGILQNSSVPTVALGTNGAAPTYAALVALESQAAVSNALVSDMAYVTNPKVRGKLKTTPVLGTTFPTWVWTPDNQVNGYPVYASNQIPANLTKGTATGTLSAIVFGNFGDAIWAMWSGLDVMIDPYTGGTAGNVRVIELQDAGFNLRRTESFAVIKDADPT
jgi:HK97 family phage major capsid protein